ncbi:hypothetical protein [Phnomibacter ginsenosidimutans]|uniref:Uncharacterized protein n=1 Tax=Phnomibacter ginsenosidimutans TaxID=2676868 RepID=A0A6I6G957_9BACT|nr:hypothetical protein [Phnomibacter ginsenosidimutans]QGW28884.1 hypothetical protein GLV81_12960 [Phnomibacter ginsenosidimutans]
MKVIHYSNSIRHFDNELAFERHQRNQQQPTNSTAWQNDSNTNMFLVIGVVLIIGAIWYYYYSLEAQKKIGQETEDENTSMDV